MALILLQPRQLVARSPKGCMLRPVGLQRAKLFSARPSACLSAFNAGQQSSSTAAVSRQKLASVASAVEPAPSARPVVQKVCKVLALGLAVAALSCLSPSTALAAGDAVTTSTNPVSALVSFILHLDKHIALLIQQHGQGPVLALLFAIVFAETGLVLTPFLPGDSLLFAAGAFAGMGQLNVVYVSVVFIVSAILGDAVNYAVGAKLGKWALERGIIKAEYIRKTEKFYDKYGGKTVVLARFVPIVRTFAPFVAGVGSMPYGRFGAYNVGGALLWTFLFVGAGFFFGNLPFVQKNFTLVVLGIVAVSVVPVVFEIIQARKEAAEEAARGGDDKSGGSSGGGVNFA